MCAAPANNKRDSVVVDRADLVNLLASVNDLLEDVREIRRRLRA